MKHTVRIKYDTSWGETLCLISRDNRYPMSWMEGNIWQAEVESDDLKEYFFAVVHDGLIVRIDWDNHSTKAPKRGEVIEEKWIDAPQGCPFPRRHQQPKFDIPGFRGAGVAVPVFSLRSAKDFGIGEFNDLKLVVDWAVECGLTIIQVLPINDTTRKGTWKDSYPYSPVSSFGLHPLYANLQDMGVKAAAAFKKAQKAINEASAVDYPRVYKEKMAYMHAAFKENGAADMATAAFAKFVKENSHWLEEYCLFCAKRDKGNADFYKWLQFHLDRQLSKVVAYAHKKGVSLKGDLPIGVSADSADAYYHPELFNLDSTAGAPPDFFSADGQNWGFPTYNWEEMAKDHYAWWKSRLRKMSEYFDAFRIDHILGFFRIWEIPGNIQSGMYGHFNPALPYSIDDIHNAYLEPDGLFLEDPRHPGYYQPMIAPKSQELPMWQQQRFGAMYEEFFYRRHNEFWRRNAERKLPELLSASGMLACGEDLGMVPDCVPGVMDHWKILSLEMVNMEKGRPWPYFSVCASSSHDMMPLRMERKGNLSCEECRNILAAHFHSASMLAIHPIQDYFALDGNFRREDWQNERVNDPSNPENHWAYRVHVPLEELVSERASGLNEVVKSLLKESNR